jgi:hypothetical protein
VDRDAVVDRYVGRDHYGVRGDDVLAHVHQRRHAALDLIGVRAGEDAAAPAVDRLGEPREVFERMELSLLGKAQAGAAVERRERRALEQLDRAQAGAVRGLELLLQRLALVALGEEQIAVDPAEIALDALFPDDGLDALDRRAVAVGGEPRALAAVQLLQLEVAVVELVGEMRRGRLRHPARHRAVVQHGDALAGAHQQIRCRQPGNTRADDADVDLHALLEGGELR